MFCKRHFLIFQMSDKLNISLNGGMYFSKCVCCVLQRNGCWAIRNIVSRSRDLCGVFLKAGAEEIINSVIRTHKECEYDAKSALRDLGCKVEFKEQWTGKGLGRVKR